MAHRGDISRGQRLTNKLLDELEGLTDNRQLFEKLGEPVVSVSAMLTGEPDGDRDIRLAY